MDLLRIAARVAAQSATSQCFTVGIYGQPGVSVKHEDVDTTAMLEAPFREAGASHFSWNKGGCQMMVPPEAVPAVLQALKAAQEGSHGEDLQKIFTGFQHEYTLDQLGNRVIEASSRPRRAADMVKVWVDEATGLFKVEYAGKTHLANMPEDPDEGGEPQNVNGDINILIAATHAWNGEPYFEMTPEEFSTASGGYWAP